MNTESIEFGSIGSGQLLPSDKRRADIAGLSTLKATSSIDKHIVRLLSLHPDLNVQFRNQDLSVLGDATKLAIIEDINEILGIQPLQTLKHD